MSPTFVHAIATAGSPLDSHCRTYEPNFWWWEVKELLRKFFITGAVAPPELVHPRPRFRLCCLFQVFLAL